MSGYKFQNYFLDVRSNTLSCNDNRIDIGERNLLLLKMLAEASPGSVDKHTLTQTLWKDSVVSDWSLSRLISDTRQILGDDGDKQQLIKTARGIGFKLQDPTPVYLDTPEQVQPQTPSSPFALWRNRSFAVSIILTLFTLCYLAIAEYQQQQLINAVERIRGYQEHTYTAFKAQVARRNELVSMIESRLDIERDQQFEKFFARYFDQLNEEEHFVFQQIRGITESGLYQNNLAILNELDAYPQITQQIALTRELQQHLQFWLNKYNTVFTQRQDMCLLYVGVEDGVPYPSGVDQNVIEWLAQKQP